MQFYQITMCALIDLCLLETSVILLIEFGNI
jgi:hypothetical protein